MKKLFAVFLFSLPALVFAQEKGIHFEHNLSWKEVQAKAKTEHKYIFMDCFTTWCGPCKYMSANIFPQEEVGAYFNQNYISVKIQLDTTAADNEEVKKWYQSGHDLAKQYAIMAYPTYLFFDESGVAVHRSVGSSEAAFFVTKAKDAKDPEKQYYSLLKKYNDGQNDSAFLRTMATAAMNAYDMEKGKKIANEYLATQTDLYTQVNLGFIMNFTSSSTDKGFAVLLNNPVKADAIAGKGFAEDMVQRIIIREVVNNKFPQSTKDKPNWDDISVALTSKFPAQAPEALAKSKVIWYQRAKDWNNYQVVIKEYMAKYGANVSAPDLNNYAWTVFQNCKDMTCVTEALDWSKRSFADFPQAAFMDTYANILYKMGKKKEAIEWETKASALVDESSKKDYLETIDKMNKGEKTWND
jgi:thioredoxin-related protein